MAEKRKYVRETLVAGGEKTYQYTDAIEDGVKWVVKKFLASAENIGDELSCRFTLQFGGITNEITTVHISNTPIVVPIEREYIGNGTKRLKMIVKNNSSSSREISFTIDGYQLN